MAQPPFLSLNTTHNTQTHSHNACMQVHTHTHTHTTSFLVMLQMELINACVYDIYGMSVDVGKALSFSQVNLPGVANFLCLR